MMDGGAFVPMLNVGWMDGWMDGKMNEWKDKWM